MSDLPTGSALGLPPGHCVSHQSFHAVMNYTCVLPVRGWGISRTQTHSYTHKHAHTATRTTHTHTHTHTPHHTVKECLGRAAGREGWRASGQVQMETCRLSERGRRERRNPGLSGPAGAKTEMFFAGFLFFCLSDCVFPVHPLQGAGPQRHLRNHRRHQRGLLWTG